MGGGRNYMKFEPCEKCKNNKIPGYIEVNSVLRECECRTAWKMKSSLLWELKEANLLSSEKDLLWDYSLSMYKGANENIQKLHKIMESKELFKFYNYYFWGQPNTQKTTIAKWMGKIAIKDFKLSTYYMSMNALVELLGVIKKDKEHYEKINKIKNIDVLIIDDAFDAKKIVLFSNNFQLIYFNNFLQERLQNESTVTIFASSAEPSKINTNHFGMEIPNILLKRKTIIIPCTDNINRENAFIDINSIFSNKTR